MCGGIIYDKSFINGEFLEQEEAKVSYEDRGYVFGDGIYEYIRAYEGKLFTVKEHFERFLRSANEIGLDLNYTVDELIELVRKLLEVNGVKMVGFIFKQHVVHHHENILSQHHR